EWDGRCGFALKRLAIGPSPLARPACLFYLCPLLFLQMTVRHWKIARRSLAYGERTLVMGILNVTPDSFSDGRKFLLLDQAVAHAERLIEEGADIIDVGGESTRPGSEFVSEQEEMDRVLPVIERLSPQTTIPISVDTTKAPVARAALEAGAEIVNDVSGLRFDPKVAEVVAAKGAGLVLMHSRGTPKDMQQLPPAENILNEVISGLRESVRVAGERGVLRNNIAIDPGIGFGKTVEQNLELIAKLDQITREFAQFPILIGTSRKSFLGRLLGGAPADQRLSGSLATVVASVLHGAHIVRVHDVRESVEAVRVADASNLKN